jgi:anti-sigma regulatory factor (Ser/Thr protein kinase)
MREVVQQTLDLSPDPSSPRAARAFASEVVSMWGLPMLADEVRLVTSELVTNAVLHSRTKLTLRVTRDDPRGVLRIAVRDGNPAHPRRRHYSDLATTGRGLAMVHKTSQAFGVEPLPDGKQVWVELRIAQAESDLQAGSTW